VLDPDQLARVALDEVVAVMGAERAFLFLADADGGLRFKAGRGQAGDDLPEPHGYSRTALETAAARRQPVLLSGADEGELATAASIVAHDIRSIVAAPLILRDRVVGVLYLDNRLARGVFGPDDLVVVTAVASQVAVAFETSAAFADQAALARANVELLEMVKAQVGELRRSRGRITAAEERLRREIGEMLHSRVQSRLLVAWHRLGQGIKLVKEQPDEATVLLTEVRDELDDIREREIRQASHLLHPAVLRVGLLPALRSLINTFGEQFEVELRADAAVRELDDPAENRIDEAIRLAAYRVVEQALANVAKHAGAAHVTVTVELHGRETLAIAVRDDGRGFDPSRRGDGLGLTSIATRVEAAGGDWDIASAPGVGTTLSLRLPIGGAPAEPGGS
jgi:signal transduction histidine kinase